MLEADFIIQKKRANGENLTQEEVKTTRQKVRQAMQQLRTSNSSLSSLCMQSEQVKSDLLSIDLWLKRRFSKK